jgi:Flp pilus assembly pilin Flp
MDTFRVRSKKGAGLVEYALILVLVSIVAIGALSLTGTRIQQIYCSVTETLRNPGAGGGSVSNGSVTARFGGISNCETVGTTLKDVELAIQPAGSYTVAFYIDGTLIRTESINKYCIGGGGDGTSPCVDYNISSLAAGKHTLRAVVGGAATMETSIVFYISK